ncbi:lipopolysaccharide biosynthesis protein [Rubellimicrobium arenae]|uniref:lipopolysaccharide biosynthesis protein n=1 Tax=Rubellimicrobium arenae TaxID=2817372 RepID=UPI001B30AD05|nr:lipopolysaccharide biosynthesis protein [Rubellimicrobium arenae]
MSPLRLAVIFSLLDKYLGQVLAIGTTAVMARVLTPTETGLYLVAQAFILLAENVREFGVNTYLIQAASLKRAHIRTSFTITMLLSLVMGGAIYLGASAIAGFYGDPDLVKLLQVAAFGFVVAPFGSPIVSLLKREMDFQTLARVNVSAAVVASVLTIGLGLMGFGAVSYIWAYVGASVALAALAFRARPDPGIFRPSLIGLGQLLSFGTIATAVTLTNMAYDLLPKLVLGKVIGFDGVGLFTRALTICQLPDRFVVSGLQPVVLPAMAERARNGSDLKKAYLRGHAVMSAVQWPALLMLAILADPIVRVLLGAQWGDVPPLVRLLAVAMVALAPAFMTYPLLVSAGRIRYTLYASLLSLPPSAAILILAAPHGLTAVATSALVTSPMQMLVSLFFIRRAIGLNGRDLVRASAASLGISGATLAIPVVIVLNSPSGLDLDWSRTVAAIAGGALGWAVGLRLSKHPLGDEILNLWRHALARKPRGGAVTVGRAG